jgi:hypothetical protein
MIEVAKMNGLEPAWRRAILVSAPRSSMKISRRLRSSPYRSRQGARSLAITGPLAKSARIAACYLEGFST